jgi:acetyl esterase/lipase
MINCNHFRLFLVASALLLSSSNLYAADGSDWNIASRLLPPPAAASEALSSSIASTPQPTPPPPGMMPQTPEQWEAFIEQATSAQTIPLETLAQMSNTTIEKQQLAGVTVYSVTPDTIAPEHKDHLFLHVHGGGYVILGGDAAPSEAATIAASSGIRSISVDYRMPPAAPFPAAVDDTIAVYREILKTTPANKIAIGGTSAGGGLSFAAVHKMKELGLPLPGAIFAGTPWADLSKTSDTLFTNEGIDRVLISYDGLLSAAAEIYADGEDLKHPLISPLYGDFSGFPPTILISGTRDLLLSDTVRAQRKLRDEGIIADLHVFEGMSHAGYLLEAGSPEAISSMNEISLFFKKHLD